MLLVLDVGNTNTVVGVYDGRVLVDHWRIATEKGKTADEWGILFRDLFEFDRIDTGDFEGLIISSVVPPVLDMLQGMAEKYFHATPLIVGPELDTRIVPRWERTESSMPSLPMHDTRET